MSYQNPVPQYGGEYATKPDSNLVWGILTTILCCMPLGIVSIVYAAKVDGLWLQGNAAGAEAASKSAKQWAIWAIVAGVAAGVVVGVLYVIRFLAVDSSMFFVES